jgi:hypothetical protein
MRWGVITLLATISCGTRQPAEAVPSDLLGADPGEAAPVTLWRGCQARQLDADRVDIDCPGLSLQVARTDARSFEPVLDAYIEEQVYRRPDEQVTDAIATYQLHVGGDAFPGRSYRRTPRTSGAPIELGWIAVGQDASGSTRRLTCHGRAVGERVASLESDCKAAMIYVLTHGVPRDLSRR